MISGFNKKGLATSTDSSLKMWRITSDVIYDHGNHRIIVPVGFKTDFASIPKPLQWVRHPIGSYAWAAVVHDYLLHRGAHREYARAVFSAAMRDLNVNIVQRSLLGGAVWAYDKSLELRSAFRED